MMINESNQAFGEALVKSLIGERGHIPIARALPDITAELAGKRTGEAPYTIYQLLKHMSYWQSFLLTFLEGGKPVLPSHVMESWPSEERPENDEEWAAIVQHFLNGVDKACQIAREAQLDEKIEHFPTETKAGILRNIASHNSYHLGEIVLLRRINGAWPPPGGGYPA
jgi:uncharacterized damage-inducible protein DinB